MWTNFLDNFYTPRWKYTDKNEYWKLIYQQVKKTKELITWFNQSTFLQEVFSFTKIRCEIERIALLPTPTYHASAEKLQSGSCPLGSLIGLTTEQSTS
jgi:hypothetical protein